MLSMRNTKNGPGDISNGSLSEDGHANSLRMRVGQPNHHGCLKSGISIMQRNEIEILKSKENVDQVVVLSPTGGLYGTADHKI
jgi:hypothetical protein